MIAWINFSVLLVATILFPLFYVRSVSPAGREMLTGEQDLLLRYGEPYAEYCRRTGRFLPKRRRKKDA